MQRIKQLLHYLRHDFIKINWDGTMHGDEDENDFPQRSSQINPATGLPMFGALDSMGNAIGSSSYFERQTDF